MHMRKLFFVIIALLLHPDTAQALPKSITLVADHWCPYNCNPSNEKPGYVIEIAKAIFEPQGINVKYVVEPWTRALRETQRGKYTAAIGATKKEAPDAIFPNQRIGVSAYHFYTTTKSHWKYAGIKSLSAISLGVVDAYNYNTEMDNFIEEYRNQRERVQVVSGNTATIQNIKKLFAGRIDVMLEDPNVVMDSLMRLKKSDHLRDAGALSTNSREDDLYLAFSPKQPDVKVLVKMFDNGIKTIRANGELAAILGRYGLGDWE